MYRYFGEQLAYTFFNMFSYYALIISTLFFFRIKRTNIGLYARQISNFISRSNQKWGTIAEYLFAFIETYILARIIDNASVFNRPFGEFVNTGANYFAEFIAIPILCLIVSLFILANPLKQMDLVALMAPIQLFFFKVACFFNGCCHGIEWKYGLYNHFYQNPGRQVPVQAIEVFFALAIFIFLLTYRKKAKTGRLFPIYMVLYGGTRFFSEFLTAAYPRIIGPFNTYHVLCLLSVIIGLIIIVILNKYDEKISNFLEIPRRKIEMKIKEKEALKAAALVEENARRKVERQRRLEQAKKSRAKSQTKKNRKKHR